MKITVPKSYANFAVWFALFIVFVKNPAVGENILTKELFTAPEKWNEGSLTFSEDGQQYAFAVKTDQGEYVVNNGKTEKTFPDVGSIEFAPKSAKLFYWVKDKDNRISLMADDNLIPTDYVIEGWLIFSKDGKR